MSLDKHIVTNAHHCSVIWGFPGGTSGKEPACQYGRHKAWSLGGEDPLEEGMQPPPVFLLGESHGQRRLGGNSPWGLKESDMTEQLHVHALSLRSAYLPLSASLANIIFFLCLCRLVFSRIRHSWIHTPRSLFRFASFTDEHLLFWGLFMAQ